MYMDLDQSYRSKSIFFVLINNNNHHKFQVLIQEKWFVLFGKRSKLGGYFSHALIVAVVN